MTSSSADVSSTDVIGYADGYAWWESQCHCFCRRGGTSMEINVHIIRGGDDDR